MEVPVAPGLALEETTTLVGVPGVVANCALIFGVASPATTVTADPYVCGTSFEAFAPAHVGSKFTVYESGTSPAMAYVPLAAVTADPLPGPASEDTALTQMPLRPLGLKTSVTVPVIDPGAARLSEASIPEVTFPLETTTG